MAKGVGGDDVDFIPVEKNKLAFCLGDISGKGMPAALLMSNLQASVRGQTLVNSNIKDCMEKINSMLFHNTPPEKFSTFFYGTLDSENHKISYSNAGHNYPFLVSEKKGLVQLKEGDIVLGCIESFQYSENVISLEPEELLLMQQVFCELTGLSMANTTTINWAISGKNTQSGKPLLVASRSSAISHYGTWKTMAMNNRTSEISGVFLAGIPFPFTGTQDSVLSIPVI